MMMSMDDERALKRARQAKKMATTTWRDQGWINHFCGGVLTKDAALPYFCSLSNPFYDRMSNNEMIKMQNANPQILEDKEGIRYMLHYSYEPNLYVIKKEQVTIDNRMTMVTGGAPSKIVKVLNCYYILGGMVYQAPIFHRIVSSRMFNTLYSMNKLFHQVQPSVHYSTITGQYYWQFEDDHSNDNITNVDEDLKKSRREIEEDELINRSTRPPYSNEMQYHIDKLIYDMEVETHGELRRRMEEKQLLLEQQQQQQQQQQELQQLQDQQQQQQHSGEDPSLMLLIPPTGASDLKRTLTPTTVTTPVQPGDTQPPPTKRPRLM